VHDAENVYNVISIEAHEAGRDALRASLQNYNTARVSPLSPSLKEEMPPFHLFVL